MSASSALRVGTPSFLVARPLDLGLEREPGFDVRYDLPSVLIGDLRAGALDVALVSTIELFRRPGYRYLAGPAVTGRGHVASVQVFLRRPLEEIETVALDPASRAARALTRIVLPSRTVKTLSFVDVAVGADAAAEDADAWLRIGDQGLREFLDPNALPTFNPSEAWTEDTGLPFVFAVWIVAPGVDLTPPQLEAFAAARARGEVHIDELAAEASREWNLPLDSCRAYLGEECVYDPGDDLEPALVTFRDAAAPLSLCLPDVRPEPIPVPSAECPG